MATYKSVELNNLEKSVQNSYGGTVRCYTASFSLGAQAVGDELELCVKPQAGVFLFATVNSSVSLATSTLTIDGQTKADYKSEPVKAPAKYAAAKTFTTPNIPVLTGGAGKNEQTLFPEVIKATVGTAALPAAGDLVITVFVGTL